MPVADRPVAAAVIERLLCSVALCERASDDGPAVSACGHYALGPLRGGFEKPYAEHIGAAARAQRRARTIAEIETELERLAERDRVLESEVTALDGRLETLAASSRHSQTAPALQARGAPTSG